MKIIKQASMIQTGNDVVKKDIAFDEAGILAIDDHIDTTSTTDEIIDAAGCYVLPGLIDVHVHLREPGYEHKETIITGTKAAAHGGFTTIMAMPNVIPYPDHVDTLKGYLAYIKQNALVHVVPYACISEKEKGKKVTDIEAITKLGLHAFSDDGVGVPTKELMKEAMMSCAKHDAMIVAHTEDMSYRPPLGCMHEGIRNHELDLVGIASACEYAQVERDLKLAMDTKCAYHICHMSAKESVAYLAQYKALGVNCSGEVTAHHLLLDEMAVENSNFKMNPPLRSKEDREALIQGLLDGTIDMIASDHAPHTQEEKSKGMVGSPFGIVALETAFPLLYTTFVKEQKVFTLERLVYWMSEAPAKRFGFANKGKLQVGYDADIILVDLEHMQTIDKNTFYSKGKNTPFDGIECYGWVQKTYVEGKLVYEQ